MKFPPAHSRARTILNALLAKPLTVYQGIEHHSLLGLSEPQMHDIYRKLEGNGWLTKTGVVYSVSVKARLRLAPDLAPEADIEPAAPAYRGNWVGSVLTAASARRSGAAFGINFRQ